MMAIDNPNVFLKFSDSSDNTIEYTIENSGYIPDGTYDIMVYAKDGYSISSAGGYDDSGEWVGLTLSSDKKTAYENNYTLKYDINFMIETMAEPKILLTLDDVNVYLDMHNVTLDTHTIIEVSGEVVSGFYNITLHAKEGYLINSAGGYDSGEWVGLTLSNDKKTAAKLNYDLTDNIDFMIESMVEQPTLPEGDGVSGFNHLYMVDKNILRELSEERFARSVGENVIDLGQYIVNVLELPFSIGNNMNGLETQITLGASLIKTKAVELLDDELTLDLGEIFIPSKYKNSYDYINTNIYLHLPFTKTIELNIDYLINEKITIQYIIDLFNGDTSVIIRSTKLGGEIVHNERFKIGKDIPFINKSGNIVGNLQNNNGLNNQLFVSFIEVIRNKPYETDNRFNDDTTIQTKLLNEKGFVTVNNITLNSNATLQEQDRIISILSNGVYIK